MDHEPDHEQLQPEPLSPVAHQFEPWLTVSESVAYCSSKGLERTPKTIRKWALRSHKDGEVADLTVRREDIENGFRWSIDRDSLDRKIAQEKDFERRNRGEPVHTPPHTSEPEHTGSDKQTPDVTEVNPGKPVRTGAAGFAEKYVVSPGKDTDARLIETLKEHIKKQDEQILFYREELRDRRTSTKALAEVIQAFRLNAENQSHRQSGTPKHHDVREPRPGQEGDSDLGTNSRTGI